MPPEQRGWVAENLDLAPGGYQDRFFDFFGASGRKLDEQTRLRVERSFAAQVSWDDTMAESIANVLDDKPGTQVVHLAGAFHVAYHQGTVERLQRRIPGSTVAVISPLQADAPEGIPEALQAALQEEPPRGDYLLQVSPLPVKYLATERSAAHHPTRERRQAAECLP